MTPSDFTKIQRWCFLLTLVLTAAVIWPSAVDSTVAKLPLFFIGSSLAFALLISASLHLGKGEFPAGAVGIILVAHFALFLLSAWRTYDQVYTWNALALGVSSLFIFLVATQAYSAKREVERLLKGITWLTAGLCVIGILQYFGIELFSFTFLIGPERRIPSFLGSSVMFGSYLVIVFPLLLAQAFADRGKGKSSTVTFVLIGTVIVSLLLTQTRSSLFGLLASIVVFVLLTMRSRKLVSAILVVVLASATLAVLLALVRPEIGTRFTQMFGDSPKSSFARRTYFWEAGKDAFLASPVVGHGIGSYERMVFDYRSPEYWVVSSEDIVPHAHNEIIEIGVEYGVVGLLFLLAMLGLVFRQGVATVRTAKPWERWIAAGITSSIVGIAVDNLANISLRTPPIALLVWLLMGLLFSPALSRQTLHTVSIPTALPRWAAALPLLVWGVTTVLYAGGQRRVINASLQMGDAMLCHVRHDETGALEHYRAAVMVEPTNLTARFYLTQGYLNQFQWEKALRSAEELQQLSPRYPQSFLMKAFALFRLQRYPEALESIEQELQHRTYPFAYLIQASIYRALSNERQERDAMVCLLRKDVESRQLFSYRSSCQRLLQITRTQDEVRENLALFDALESIVPQDHDFFASLKEQISR